MTSIKIPVDAIFNILLSKTINLFKKYKLADKKSIVNKYLARFSFKYFLNGYRLYIKNPKKRCEKNIDNGNVYFPTILYNIMFRTITKTCANTPMSAYFFWFCDDNSAIPKMI